MNGPVFSRSFSHIQGCCYVCIGDMLKFKMSIRVGKKGRLSDFEHCMVVGARHVCVRISETDELLGFFQTTISRVYK